MSLIDLIDRNALIKKLGIAKDCFGCDHNKTPFCLWKENQAEICEAICDAPTIEPEPSIPISWIERHIDWLKDMDNGFANITAMNIETMLRKWREERAVRI